MKRGDAAICFRKFEMALAAQNCMSPGCAALLSNLILVPPAKTAVPKDSPQYMKDYLRGCSMEVHSGPLGPFFIGMTFFEAVA